MRSTGLGAMLTAVSLFAAFVILAGATSAYAGETSVYFKSGWYTWDEKINGSSFVKESGFIHAAGVLRKDAVSVVDIAERFEVWGGNLDYDGHDLTNTTDIKTDTSYLGTREEVAVGVKLPVAGTVTVEPFIGVGHKFWIRTRSSEDWNTFFGRGGVSVEKKTSSITMFAKGGAILPIYTRTHVSLSEAGLEDVVTEPRSRVSGFAEGGVKVGSFSLSVEYEAMEFGESEKVSTRPRTIPTGAAVINGEAYQPTSSSSYVSFKLGYTF